MGEIIWQKAKGASGSCAWGTWLSAKGPRIRDLHEYLLVFAKEGFSRSDKGESDITKRRIPVIYTICVGDTTRIG